MRKMTEKRDDNSKPSSVTTSYTQMTTSTAFSDYSTNKDTSKGLKKRDTKKAKSSTSKNLKVGNKRPA
jgi:hypothetical protein